MFEVDDKNLGRAKVVNITEARQSMASIMTDQDFSYIITKNNQPIRVILSYEVLNRIQGSPKAASIAKEKVEVSRRSIQGLLKEREADIQRHQPVKESVKKAVGEKTPAWVFEDAPKKQKDIPVIKNIPETAKIEAYKSHGENISTEDVDGAIGEVNASYFDAPETESGAGEIKEFEGDFFEVSDEEAFMPPPPSESKMAIEINSQIDETEEEVEPQKEEDYFSRFRKLYEGASKKLDSRTDAVVNKPAIQEKQVASKTMGVKQQVPVYDAPILPPALPVKPSVVPAAKVVPPPLPVEAKIAKQTNDFPSIEELLEELEKEKLSGE